MLNLDFDEASVVVVGNLNPAIFHPEWFGRNELLREEEVKLSREDPGFIITPQVAQFNADWLFIQITQNRFLARTSDAGKFTVLRDLAVSTFSLLDHTPVRLLGLNRSLVYLTESVEQWHAVGHALAPKEPWRGAVDDPGMLEVHMQCTARVDDADYLRVKVRPSEDPPNGVRFDFNEQFSGDSPTAEQFVAIIEREWEAALAHFALVSEHVLGQVVMEAP